MRIRDLFEGEMILLESYKDYRQVYMKLMSFINDKDLMNIQRHITNLGIRNKFGTVDFPQIIEMVLRNKRYVDLMKSPNKSDEVDDVLLNITRSNIRTPTDISSWIASISLVNKQLETGSPDPEFRSRIATYVIHNLYTMIHELVHYLEEDIKSRDAEYTTVAKTSSYIIFDVKNFAAAKKLRNQLPSCDWCIGANESMFKSYGESQGRKTYIVYLLKTKKGIAIHVNPSNPSDNLITSHSNGSDGSIRSGSLVYNRGAGVIEDDLYAALSKKEVEALFRAVNINFISKDGVNLNQVFLQRFLSDLKDRDVSLSAEVSNEVNQIKTYYKEIYERGDLSRIVSFLSQILDDVNMRMGWIPSDDSEVDAKDILANIVLMFYIVQHIKELVDAKILPNSMSSGGMLYNMENIISLLEDGRVDLGGISRVNEEVERYVAKIARDGRNL